MNEQFSSVFTKENTSTIPNLGTSKTPDAPNIIVGKEGVLKLLLNLNPHKAMGPDQLSTRFLREMATSITPSLTLIFQTSLERGTVPDDWKTAHVTPIFKKGDKSKPSNYRPVSLTSVCCKTLEHIIFSHLMKFCESHNILSDKQHGFRKKRSCESQLILTIQDLAAGLNSKSQIDAILVDFSKAFDKVPHERLAAKLHHYGIRGNTLAWIKSFLANRDRQVILDGAKSSSAPVSSGVPQGTVIGPLLFLVYINDLLSNVNTTGRLFADDCLLYRTIKTTDDAVSLQNNIDTLQQWEKDWLMSFNPDKCEVIRITKRKKIIDAKYTIHGQVLHETNRAKYLGVTIDNTLSWSSHIDIMTKKANNTTAFLRRNLSSCPADVKSTCYKTLVRPQLEYAATVWDPWTQTNISKIEAVQRRAAHFTLGDYRRTSSVSSMLHQLKWDNLITRRQQSKVTMIYRVIHQLVAIPSAPYLQPTSVRTRGNNMRFLVPFTSVNSYKNSFFPSTVRLWNSLPSDITRMQSLEAFKGGIASSFH